MDEMNVKKSTNTIRLIINGREIPNLSSYSYFDVKNFFKEPTRTTAGVINKLNSYATFLTPRLKFSFKLMPVGAYRVLMKLIKEYNEFIVQAYDIVEDKYVTRKMYFKPKDFPQIYQKSLEVLAIQDESFEMVGTNSDLETISLVYNKNIEGSTITSGLEFSYGDEVVIGDYDSEISSENPRTWTRSGYIMTGWNTKPDGSGTSYATNHSVFLTSSMVLYAQWEVDS